MVGLIGCNYEWCSEIPKVTLAQFLVGYVFATVGYPFCMGLTGALFSKVLGPIPQVSFSGVYLLSWKVLQKSLLGLGDQVDRCLRHSLFLLSSLFPQ